MPVVPADRVVNAENISTLVHRLVKDGASAMTGDYNDFELKMNDILGKWRKTDNRGQEAAIFILGKVSFDSRLGLFGDRMDKSLTVCTIYLLIIAIYRSNNGPTKNSDLTQRRKEIGELKLKFAMDFLVEIEHLLGEEVIDYLKSQAGFLDCLQRVAEGDPIPAEGEEPLELAKKPYTLYSWLKEPSQSSKDIRILAVTPKLWTKVEKGSAGNFLYGALKPDLHVPASYSCPLRQESQRRQ
jgi:hypothetical protein